MLKKENKRKDQPVQLSAGKLSETERRKRGRSQEWRRRDMRQGCHLT